MTTLIKSTIDSWLFLGVWMSIVIVCLGILVHDLSHSNQGLMAIMKLVWFLTVLYSGPIGLGIYYMTGRKQIAHDTLWTKSFRSVSHCYSGCGAGEVIGIIIAGGLLSLGNIWITIITFILAFLAGYILTVVPLVQGGMDFADAIKDAIYSETTSIAVMEIVAISVDRWLGGAATMADPIFWSSLIVSLSFGLFAAYPVNVLLIKMGVKEGMANPQCQS